MDNLFITDIHITKVRHLENIDIHICDDKRKNLIITGRNGSGKTNVLEALKKAIFPTVWALGGESWSEINFKNEAIEAKHTLVGSPPHDLSEIGRTLYKSYMDGDMIIKYFPAKRNNEYEINKNIVKPEIFEGKYFHSFLVHLKVQEKFEEDNGDTKKWFNRFENMLKEIYKDDTLELEYDYKNYLFSIKMKGREPFGFNQFSDGYSSIIGIIGDIIMSMEKNNNRNYDVQGIVLIDEIETHLHLELQKVILPFIAATFPNIQFIVATHSPFVITSDPNAVVFDLEHQKRLEDLTDFSYEGVVEGYFNIDKISIELRNDFEKYKNLLKKSNKTNDDINEIIRLESKLDEVPDLLNLEFAAEYTQLKFYKEFE